MPTRKHFDVAWLAALILFIIGAVLAVFVEDVDARVLTALLFSGLAFLTLS